MAYYLSNLNNNEKYETNQSYNSTKVFNSKLVLLGDTSVGKSCIVVRFAKNEFYEYQESTIGAAFMTQLIDIGECTIKFEIWDTAGSLNFLIFQPFLEVRREAGIVYDITNKKSFEGAKGWIHELNSVHSNDIIIALAGNKNDLEEHRAVDRELAESFANSNNILFIETSAKTGQNVNELFLRIAKKLPLHKKEQEKCPAIQINNTEETKKKCC
ncbi:hypothetical protein PFHG_00350 [Plasmodium falciparum HB3]|uniref:Ras-related protein Rab-5C n=1 Tax=Plasmodium falciparum (isolate HB3) TaxID=137071 RepID=A0A0L7K691_PLAFX|nr:hypothetical protein PFHG_00350 [Plasmodium falciparum HB3]